MTIGLSWQPSLFGSADGSPAGHSAASSSVSFEQTDRRELTEGAWIELVTRWYAAADQLFETVLGVAPWHAAERPMYDRIVAVPRLHTGVWIDPPEELSALAEALSTHYEVDLGSITANLYRDGSDSVAWHGDRVGRVRADTVVAILTLGESRRLLLRPNGGGRSIAVEPAAGDLFVMGGTCQRTWEHSVPKRARAGPRICVMFREAGGN